MIAQCREALSVAHSGENATMKTSKRATRLFGLAVVLAVGSIQLCAADVASEVAAIHAADDAWVKAFNTGDVDTMVSLYDEHAVLLPPGAPPASGQAAIRAFLTKMVPAAAKDGLAFTLGDRPAGPNDL